MTDYTVYNNHYQYMNQILNSLKVQNEKIGLRRNSFSEVFSSANQTTVEAPENMDGIFEEAAEKYNVPLNLLKAMAKAESNFNEKAVSSAGAQGVMQLMPATAKALGVEDAFDARDNIMGGAKYIAEKLEQYNGDIDLALAAYNAGSGNVRKYGGVPPFQETRNYIKRIKEYMGMELSAQKSVMTTKNSSNTENMLSGVMDDTAISNALYVVELMKMRLQMQINSRLI